MPSLLILTYDIRAGADRAVYEQWLRDVDCPFFNRQPQVDRYENWKVTRHAVGDLGFPYFDLIWLKPGETFDSLFGSQPVREFSAGWIELWAIDPEATDPATNFKGGVAEVIASPGLR